MSKEIFTIKARRCKRCGGLLTSKKAVKDRYGHTCKIKAHAEAEAAKPDPNQLVIFGVLEDENK